MKNIMKDYELTLLSKGQIFGIDGESQLSIIKKYGIESEATDLALLTGVTNYYMPDGTVAAEYWTSTIEGESMACAIDPNSTAHYDRMRAYLGSRNFGVRPVLKFSSTFPEKFLNIAENSNGIKEVEYGEYPQKAVDNNMQNILDMAYLNNTLKNTGRSYTFDSRPVSDYYSEFFGVTYDEYEYEGKRYIRVKANFSDNYSIDLSNGESCYLDDNVWVEVLPVRWLVDDVSKCLVSKNTLLSGIMYHNDTYLKSFSESNIKKYLDEYMIRDLFQPKQLNNEMNQENTRKKFGFNLDSVTQEEMLQGALESNVPVFLNARSSEEKIDILRQIDKDCTVIYLKNATHDSLNGKNVYDSQSNEMLNIAPTWYKDLLEKCNAEQDKIHIVFFDEITSTQDSIQEMVFNTILERKINGIWELPENARIVVSGSTLNRKLENKFAVVNIETTAKSWLKSKQSHGIHPAIYAYIAYNEYIGEDMLNFKNGETSINPRKWKMASKILYTTNKPWMLRSLIGEGLTNNFIRFCSKCALSVEDVINGNYDDSYLSRMNKAEMFSMVGELSSVDEEHVGEIRTFIRKIEPEICDVFDVLWSRNDEKRIEIIEQLKNDELDTSKSGINK